MTTHWLAPKALAIAATHAALCERHEATARILSEPPHGASRTNVARARQERAKALLAGRTACVIQELVAEIEALTTEATA